MIRFGVCALSLACSCAAAAPTPTTPVPVAQPARAAPAAPAAPTTTVPPAASSAPLRVEGAPVDARGFVDVRALELACIADARSLTDPRAVLARFEESAGAQLVPVGELAFVVLERDPAVSLVDPPPLFCRTIASSTVLKAPLVRAKEPASRWLVRALEHGVVEDTAALVRSTNAALVGRPRLLLDKSGALVAVALPLAAGGA